jgi:phospholipid/cholesterol/gamma-HCH transport system permease protein
MMPSASIDFGRENPETLLVRLAGDWTRESTPPAASVIDEQIEWTPPARRILLRVENLTSWDSTLPTFLIRLRTSASSHGMTVDEEHLPQGVRRLLALASAVPAGGSQDTVAARTSLLDQIGESALGFWRSLLDLTDFIGSATVAVLRLAARKARFRRSDLLLVMQQCGAQALPIVSLISVLVGLIVAFIAAIQLRIFGAQIYVASLVGIGMVRALAPMMTGIIMAGRTGAAFAAQLGTMQANEEIDALETLGVSPMEFLVLPRMLALFLMMPLLSLYADLMGILGGLFIGVAMLDLNVMEYCNKTRDSIGMSDFLVGLFSAAVFGILVALAGCLRGMRSGRSASAVGEATTSAVVLGIVSMIVAMAVITGVCYVVKI